MRKNFEVSYEYLFNMNLKYKKSLMFKTTEELVGSDKLIGQKRAENAMEFGINIRERGYNIYISGNKGSRRTYYSKKTLELFASNKKVPDDWCYVYNFDNKYEPIPLSFKPGMGRVFKNDIETLVKTFIERIQNVFDSEEYDIRKNEMIDEYHSIKNSLVDELSVIAELNDLQVKSTTTGFVFIPIIDGKPMTESEYNNIDVRKKDNIFKNISDMRHKTIDIIKKLKNTEKELDQKVKKLEDELGLSIINELISTLIPKHKDIKVIKYLESLKEDMLKNLSIFKADVDRQSSNKEYEELFFKYKVNLIVDNGKTEGSPVIYEANPTFNNLMGNIEYVSKQGIIATDFSMISAGSILKANGGFLIINIEELMKNNLSWEGIKRVLYSGKLAIEGSRNQLDLLTIATIKPQSIPVDLKIIIIGSESIYQLLYEYDNEFKNLFKIKVDFDIDIEKDDNNIFALAQFISDYCRSNNIRHLNNSAVAAVIDYSSKLTGSNKRLSACMDNIINLIIEANIWAGISQNKYISRENIKKATSESQIRDNLIEDRILEQYRDKKIVISIDGEKPGQINGLSVIEIGGYTFGKPYRITASSYTGKSGIINIDREVMMSGKIHNKSVLIISGYLGSKYARDMPLSVTVHLCFEQLYGFIDGDSASIAELYAVLSSLSGIPMKQSIAVTGSMNQMGETQPVGGINEKIEGFYKVCSIYGLNGTHGVMIPYQNMDDLILEDKIMKDIKNGLFHIYGIKNVEEGIEILTGLNSGQRNEKSEYEKGTFNYYVDKKLKEFIKNYNGSNELKNHVDNENLK